MKSIKLCSALLLLLGLTVGCEKESIESPEMELKEKQEPKTLNDFVTSGVDLEDYVIKVKNIETKSNNLNKSHSTSSSLDRGAEFFDTYCSNLEVEGFELGRMRPENAGIFTGPLDYLASVGKFQPGEILPGISISTTSTVATEKPILGLYGQLVRGSESKVIYAQIADHNLLLEFNPNVQSVGLDILSFPYAEEAESLGTEPTPDPIPVASQQVTIEVTYTSGVTYTEEVTASFEGLYWGTAGAEAISQIVLSSTNDDAWVGVDNITFGVCEDNDGDGCVDAPGDEGPGDGHLNSNLELYVHIGSCNSGVLNVETADCGVWISDLFDQVEAGEYANNGQRRNAFTTVANSLVDQGDITVQQKASILGCN